MKHRLGWLLAVLAIISFSFGQASASASQVIAAKAASVAVLQAPAVARRASGSAAATKAPTSGASSASPAAGECTDASILAALPAGSTMDKYQCATASPWMWAAARVKPGPTVFFLQAKSGAWKVSTAAQACGASSSGLPPEIKVFCTKA